MSESVENLKRRILDIAGKYSHVNSLFKIGSSNTKRQLEKLIAQLLDGNYTLDKKIVLEYIISNILLTYPQYSDIMDIISNKLKSNDINTSNSFNEKNLIKATQIFIKQRMLDNVNAGKSSSASSSPTIISVK
jgi:hypothetical protein